MRRNVIIDTGVLVALLNKKDVYHQWAVNQLKNIQPPLLTCDAVISETHFLCGGQRQSSVVIFNYLTSGVIEIPFYFATEHKAIEL